MADLSNMLDRPFAPFKAYRFLVEINNGAVIGAFSAFSGVQAKVQIASARTGEDKRGIKENFPGIIEFSHVTLSKGVIGNNGFLQWLFDSTIPGDLEGKPGGHSKYKNLDIIALDDKGNRGIVWTLKDAIPVGYKLDPMDASKSAVLAEHIEFAISGVLRKIKNVNSYDYMLYDPNADNITKSKFISNSFEANKNSIYNFQHGDSNEGFIANNINSNNSEQYIQDEEKRIMEEEQKKQQDQQQ